MSCPSTFAGLLVAVTLLASAAAQDRPGQREGDPAVESAAEALQVLYAYTGFPELNAIPAKAAGDYASLTAFSDSTGLFLSDSLKERRVWRINLPPVFLDLPDWSDDWVRRYNPKDFVAFIDSTTGKLVSIFSVASASEATLPPLSARRAAEQAEDLWLGLPDDLPKCKFLQALNFAVGSSPLKAKQIIAYYVAIRDRDSIGQVQLVWDVIGRGVPLPKPPAFAGESGPPLPEDRCIVRTLVDARTGKPLYSVTVLPGQ